MARSQLKKDKSAGKKSWPSEDKNISFEVKLKASLIVFFGRLLLARSVALTLVNSSLGSL